MQAPRPDEPARGAGVPPSPSAVVILVSEARRDCQRRVRHRDQHLNGAASVVEADPAEVSQTALGEA
jgi:hypothetical protein